MSKLFKLREWLTVSEAARDLSESIGETVSEGNVFRLALDGHLKMTVDLVNGALATPDAWDQASPPVPKPDLGFLKIFGIWDLPLIDGDRLEVEHAYHAKTGGPAVTRPCSRGTFVQRLDGTVFELVEDGPGDRFYPVGGLPGGSIFVVRKDVLAEFKERVRGSSSTSGPSTRSEGNADKVGGPNLAVWLKVEMEKRRITLNRLHVDSELDRKTIRSLLRGESHRRRVLLSLAEGLAVSVSDIPTN